MKRLRGLGWLIAFMIVLTGVAATGETATLSTPDGRAVEVAVPEGWQAIELGAQGKAVVTGISNPEQSVSLQITFRSSDFAAEVTSPEKQKALVAELSRADVEQSMEQDFIFKDLRPGVGHGVYLVLTDGNLLNRQPPPGQYFKLTRGIVVAPDFVMIFTLFSQNETSDAYRAAMAVVRGVRENAKK